MGTREGIGQFERQSRHLAHAVSERAEITCEIAALLPSQGRSQSDGQPRGRRPASLGHIRGILGARSGHIRGIFDRGIFGAYSIGALGAHSGAHWGHIRGTYAAHSGRARASGSINP